MPLYSLKRHERIKKSSDFIRAYQKGTKRESRHFKVSILANNLQWSRLGVTVGKKIGGAVQRNYVKRRIREYFRLHKTLIPLASDIVFTAKPGADHLHFADIETEFGRLFGVDAPHEHES
jgi:ribonuclease P protein component